MQPESSLPPSNGLEASSLATLMTREHWLEVLRIFATGLAALLFWQGLVPVELVWAAVAVYETGI